MTRTLKLIALLVAIAAFTATYAAYDLGFRRSPPAAILEDGSRASLQAATMEACFRVRVLAFFGDGQAAAQWASCRAYLLRYQALDAVDLRSYGVMGSLGLGIAALFAFALYVRFGGTAPKLLRGPRLHAGRGALEAFTSAARRECRALGRGIAFLPGVALSRDRESRHVLIWGSVGGGKTQTMLHLILAAIGRGDGVLVLDTKGDMMAGLPADPVPLLVAPHDRRSLVWDIAVDCKVKQDARELAARFIPPSSDPMWSEAAQEIFVACLAHLQATRGTGWHWLDLYKAVTADLETLATMARDHHPPALRLLSQPESRTTQSILSTFQTHMNTVAVLAEAWAESRAGRFSIRGWLHHPTPGRPLILQHDPGYPELSRIWIGSLLGVLASAVGSPNLSESRERRIWLFLDEFPQLPPIRQFPAFLELGRSKGVVVVIGAQDIAQLRAAYGPEQAKSWMGMIGTKIITRINVSEAAEDASRLVGNQEIERQVKSRTSAQGRSSVTTSHHRESRRVVTAAEIASHLGHMKDGVRVLVLGLGKDVYELVMPYITLPSFRAPTLPADWTELPPAPPGKRPKGSKLPHRPTPLSKEMAERIRRIRH
ncbi:MAG: type IV secretion system DNA-binding domain-containing protein [Kiloniellaceae bacterium]